MRGLHTHYTLRFLLLYPPKIFSLTYLCTKVVSKYCVYSFQDLLKLHMPALHFVGSISERFRVSFFTQLETLRNDALLYKSSLPNPCFQSKNIDAPFSNILIGFKFHYMYLDFLNIYFWTSISMSIVQRLYLFTEPEGMCKPHYGNQKFFPIGQWGLIYRNYFENHIT